MCIRDSNNSLPNYNQEVLRLTTGCSVVITGKIVATPNREKNTALFCRKNTFKFRCVKLSISIHLLKCPSGQIQKHILHGTMEHLKACLLYTSTCV